MYAPSGEIVNLTQTGSTFIVDSAKIILGTNPDLEFKEKLAFIKKKILEILAQTKRVNTQMLSEQLGESPRLITIALDELQKDGAIKPV